MNERLGVRLPSWRHPPWACPLATTAMVAFVFPRFYGSHQSAYFQFPHVRKIKLLELWWVTPAIYQSSNAAFHETLCPQCFVLLALKRLPIWMVTLTYTVQSHPGTFIIEV